jgi:hypothetical protein
MQEKKLVAITDNKTDIYLSELVFSEFPIFKAYIESINPEIRIFSHKKTMYLFYPIKDVENLIRFIVFEREKFGLDDLIALIRKNNATNYYKTDKQTPSR